MDVIEEKRAKQREATRRYRERQKQLGIKRVLSDSDRERQRQYVAQKRAEAKAAGVVLAADDWWKRNPEKHRARIARWKAENADYARVIDAEAQERRRSTPWGRINNRIWPILHFCVRRGSTSQSKYTMALGYSWKELRAHLEAQFAPDMSWDSWGSVWELDHIKPLSSFKYTSLEDPVFREAWALSNLRPLHTELNASKGARF